VFFEVRFEMKNREKFQLRRIICTENAPEIIKCTEKCQDRISVHLLALMGFILIELLLMSKYKLILVKNKIINYNLSNVRGVENWG